LGGVSVKVDTNTKDSFMENAQEISEDANSTENCMVASDEEVLEISKRLIEKNKEAYEVLAQ
jgi:hypothetical protein